MKLLHLSAWLILPVLVFLLANSCEKVPDAGEPIKKDRISGVVQKGPYLIGTTLDLLELTVNLGQTGKVFRTDIENNQGAFEINNIELSSSFVEISANGFYFNEVRGENSSAQLTLSAVSDLRDKSGLNVNVLSHLEKDRLFNLVNGGMSFGDAKRQAQEEVLRVFTIEKDDIAQSEMLNIAKEGDDNAILLAVSVILQGYRDVADMSELIGKLNADLREDGILSDSSIGTSLMNNARLTDLVLVRSNLEDRYKELGIEATIPAFEKYVQQFIDSSGHNFNRLPVYPKTSPYGTNILFPETDTFYVSQDLSLAAELPEGTALRIVLSGGLWYYRVLPRGPINWDVSIYNHSRQIQEFTATSPGEESDLSISFDVPQGSSKKFRIDYYENSSETPSRSREIVVADGKKPVDGFESTFPEYGTFGPNLLAMSGDTIQVVKDEKYSIAVEFPEWDEDSITFFMEFSEDGMFSIDSAELGDWDLLQEAYNLFGMAIGKNYLDEMSIVFNKTGSGNFHSENFSGKIRIREF